MSSDLYSLLNRVSPFRWRIAWAICLGFATVGAGVGLMATSAYLISLAALQPSIADLRVAIAGVRFFGISRGVFRYTERVVSHQVTFTLLTRIRVWFYRAVEPLAPARLLAYRSGDLLSRILSDIETLDALYLRVIGPTCVAVLVTLLVVWLLGSYRATLALVVVSIMAAAGVGLSWLTGALSRNAGRRLVSLRSDLNAHLVDTVQAIAEIVAFGRESDQRRMVESLSLRYERARATVTRLNGLGSALMSFATDLAVAAALWIAIPWVHDGRLDGVHLAVVALSVMAAFEAVAPLPSAYQSLGESRAAARRLFEIIDVAPAVRDPVPAAPVPADHSILIRDLQFSYPGGNGLPALIGLNLELAEGGSVALVGPSGAGKTTLVHLLLRFWDYTWGSVRLGGRELRELSADDVRRTMSVVSQNTYLFSGTIRENLLLARPSAAESDLHAACRRARMHDFVLSLPDGYDTWIGEHGLRLSGGERQRLAIARALLQDAPLVLLDEPTANLDVLTERELMADLRHLLSGRTVLLVTHRLIGLDWADEILVLRDGTVVERGTHHELSTGDGLYRKMYELQRGEVSVETFLSE